MDVKMLYDGLGLPTSSKKMKEQKKQKNQLPKQKAKLKKKTKRTNKKEYVIHVHDHEAGVHFMCGNLDLRRDFTRGGQSALFGGNGAHSFTGFNDHTFGVDVKTCVGVDQDSRSELRLGVVRTNTAELYALTGGDRHSRDLILDSVAIPTKDIFKKHCVTKNDDKHKDDAKEEKEEKKSDDDDDEDDENYEPLAFHTLTGDYGGCFIIQSMIWSSNSRQPNIIHISYTCPINQYNKWTNHNLDEKKELPILKDDTQKEFELVTIGYFFLILRSYGRLLMFKWNMLSVC